MTDIAIVRLDRWRRRAWIVGCVGIVFCLLALPLARPRVFQAYWVAWIFCSGIGFGALVLLLMHLLSGGAWGDAVRAPAEAAAMTLPLMALLFVPFLFGIGDVFPWAAPATFAAHVWPHKQAYLTVFGFASRGVGCLLALSGITVLLGLWTRRKSRAIEVRRPSAAIGASGLLVYFALMLFASTDWLVSLEPQWSSTMFVVIFAVDHFLSALAFTVVIATLMNDADAPLAPKQLHDLGNLLLAFVIFWAYVTFSQFLIIWSGNLPREISWYLHRSVGGWPLVIGGIALVQFAMPFVLLLSRRAKRHRIALGPIAAFIFIANAAHTWWLITPSFHPDGVPFPWMETAAFAGVGGIWLAVFLGFLKQRPTISVVAGEGEVAHA